MNEIEFYLEDLKSKFTKIDFDKYYLAYSGGKDSHFLYWFIKEYLKDDKIEIISCNIVFEHKQIRDRMFKYANTIIYPKWKPNEIKENVGIPCFSKMQDDMIDRYQRGKRNDYLLQFINGTKNGGYTMYKMSKLAKTLLLENKLHRISNKCCYYFKKLPFKEFDKTSGKKGILGVRSSEGMLRKSNYKTCFTKEMKFTPIYDLTDILLDKIYEFYQIEIPPIYQHIKRTGCMGCPYGSHYGDTVKELDLLNKAQYKFVTNYFKESYDVLGIKTDKYNEDGKL